MTESIINDITSRVVLVKDLTHKTELVKTTIGHYVMMSDRKYKSVTLKPISEKTYETMKKAFLYNR